MRLLLGFFLSSVASYILITAYVWFIYWRKVRGYSLYDILFVCFDSNTKTMTDDCSFYSLIRWIPVINNMAVVYIPVSYLLDSLSRLISRLIKALKETRFNEDGDGIDVSTQVRHDPETLEQPKMKNDDTYMIV